MNYYRNLEDESLFEKNNPQHRTQLVDNFKGVFYSNLMKNNREKYGLSWVGKTTVDELSELPRDFGYNDFLLGRFVDALKGVGVTDLYFGRENSVVAYIPVSENGADIIAAATYADECDEDVGGYYRLWWD